MVSKTYVDNQLQKLGLTFQFWSKLAVKELPKILVKDEQILGIVNGRYDGGFAILCATDKRLLLIDKKPLFLNFSDFRYDTVAEVDFKYRALNAYLKVQTYGQTFHFRSWSQKQLRDMSTLIQGKVMNLQKEEKKDPIVKKVMKKAAEDLEKTIQSFRPQKVADPADINPPTRRVEFIQDAASRANKIGRFVLD
ncbi:MAG: PH domain-containing protein [bacterium]|nr:PH domain-containing protein [bacterium]